MPGKKYVLKKFIEMYRDLPCLWKSSHPNYHDKDERNAALQNLIDFFQQVDPAANKDTVQKKIASLRGAFKKELNKVKKSIRSGARGDDVHIPKLWYYEHMLFLEETDIPWPSRTPRSKLDETPFVEIEETYDCDFQSPVSPESTSKQSTTSHQSSTSRHSLKRTKAMTEMNVLAKISSKLDTIGNAKEQDSEAAFGEYVAAELRALHPYIKKFCKKIINDAIFQAGMGQLNSTSHIVTDTTHETQLQPKIELK